ncbi:MAG TPA: ATP-binding protein [Candidatus Eisenbacteria bacterium]
MRSLRVRLLLLTGSVVAIALVTVALLSQRTVRTEYQRMQVDDHQEKLARAGEELRSLLRTRGTLAGADTALAGLRGGGPGEWVLLAPDGRMLGATLPRLRSARVTADSSGRVTVEEVSSRGGGRQSVRMLLIGVPRTTIRDEEGRARATLFALPEFPKEGRETEPPFLTSVNRGLALAVLGAGLLALLLTLALSRRILGPVEALTNAARRMERGDLGARVEVRSRDEIGELAHAFNAMARALAENETLRRSLVGDVAHELRTPLTNLRCQIEAIQDGLARADEGTIRSLHEETMLLGRLVDDLQDLALAEAGRLPLHRAPVDVAAAVASAAQAVSPRASERGVSVRAACPPGLVVSADPARMGQVLRNLLENALTHTPEGGAVTIEAAGGTADGTTGGEAVTIVVSDTGSGIAPEHLPRVFERFYRADPSRARETGGAGLGLAIVKHLVEAHGGSVAVSSEPARGAVFTVTFPAATS